MCGIVGYSGANKACKILVEGLKKLEYRGYDSAGVAILESKKFNVKRCKGKIAALEKIVAQTELNGHTGIAHTRWATHGKPSDGNAHPHRAGSFIVAHNGIIENYKQLRQKLEGAGQQFKTETDTEVIPQLFEYHYQQNGRHNAKAAIKKGLKELSGGYALAILCLEEEGTVYATKSANPLIVGLGQEENFIASDVPAILEHTRQILILEDGDLVKLTAAAVEIEDNKGQQVKRQAKTIDWTPLMAEKEGYRHFMLKEIHEQPRAISDTLRGRCQQNPARVLYDDIFANKISLEKIEQLYLVACGTSFHAAMVGKHLLEKIAKVRVEVDLASEFRYRDLVLAENSLAVFISQSGETADTLAALNEIKKRKVPSLAICNALDSSIARGADFVIYTHAGPEIGVASTKAFTTQLLIFYLFSQYLAEKRGSLGQAELTFLLNQLLRVPVLLENVLLKEKEIEKIAKKYFHLEDFLFLGRGMLFPVALEGALKLKEISYIHAEGYAAGEIKHGPIALVDEKVPIVALAAKSKLQEKIVSNIEEVRTRGGRVIAIASEGDEALAGIAEELILLPEVDEILLPFVASLPLQLLAYHIAVLRGTDIDQPRNLAKSVTVE